MRLNSINKPVRIKSKRHFVGSNSSRKFTKISTKQTIYVYTYTDFNAERIKRPFIFYKEYLFA